MKHVFLLTIALAAIGCRPTDPKEQPEISELGAEFPGAKLQHKVVEINGQRVLRVTYENKLPEMVTFKLSRVYYRLYEALDQMPVIRQLGPGETFESDFRFVPEAWTASTPKLANEFEAEYSGISHIDSFNSDNVNDPNIGFSWTDGEVNKLYIGGFSGNELPRPLEVRITSIKVKGKEVLTKRIDFTLNPGERKAIPNVVQKDKPVIKYAVRLTPNKRWSIESFTFE